jgi:FMN phosphatase YigB (HAD superfamily)
LPPRACLFDLGGTLFSYAPFRPHLERLLAETARRYAIEAPPQALRRAYERASAEAGRRFAARPFYRHRELFAESLAGFLGSFGVRAEPDEGERFYTAQRELGSALATLRPGALETLRALRERGLHLGIVSNIDDDPFHPLLDRLGLARRVDATTTSEEAGSCKPDPGIFLRALAKAGGPGPHRPRHVIGELREILALVPA